MYYGQHPVVIRLSSLCICCLVLINLLLLNSAAVLFHSVISGVELGRRHGSHAPDKSNFWFFPPLHLGTF